MSAGNAPPRSGRADSLRRVAAAVVLAEGVACAGYGLVLAVRAVTGDVADRRGAVVLALCALLLGVALALAARAVLEGRRAARAPVLVWQILQVVIGADLATGSRALSPTPLPLLGVPLVLAGVLVASLVMRSDVLAVERPLD